MKRFYPRKHHWQKMTFVAILALFALMLVSCGGSVDPAKVDVKLEETGPGAKITTYTEALGELGLMTEIYASGGLKIQSNPIGDNTGASKSTGAEIPRDITEMIKSSLNSIGGYVTYIPYNPAYIQNQMVTGYSNFDKKLIPDVVITGGITEFDRGLETRGKGTDVGAEAELTGMPDWLPSKGVGANYGDSSKTGLARITLDFNMLNFQTMAGIPKMNTVNSMEVRKAVGKKELGIALFGATFGRKGSIKKVQGRHAAVRLLVELSMIQIVGKHLVLPYWRLLGEDALVDKVVTTAIEKYYYGLNDPRRIANVQEWLFLHGYDVPINGELDERTVQALTRFDEGFDPGSGTIGPELFKKTYVNIPIDQKTLGRRNTLTRLFNEARARQQQKAAPKPVKKKVKKKKTVQPKPAPAAAKKAEPKPAEVEPKPKTGASTGSVKAASEPEPAPSTTGGGIGRILSEEEW